MQIDLLKMENLGGDFLALKKTVRGGRPTSAFSLATGAKINVASELGLKVLFVATDRLAAKDYYERFVAYNGDGVAYLPDKDDVLLHRKAASAAQIGKRVEAIAAFGNKNTKAVVLSAEALTQYLPQKEVFFSSIISLREGAELSPKTLIEKLIFAGYVREEELSERGTFTARGDTVEVFPLTGKAVRISYFDDFIEGIRLFDAETRDGAETVAEVEILPATDMFISDIQEVEKKLRALKAEGRTLEIIDDVCQRLESNPNDSGLVWLIPFIKQNLNTIFDYLDDDWAIVFDEVKVFCDKLKLIETEHKSRVYSLCDGGDATPNHKFSILNFDQIMTLTTCFKRLAFGQLTSTNPLFRVGSVFNFRCQPVTRYHLDFNTLVTDLKNFTRSGYKVILCCGDATKAENTAKHLTENDVMVHVTDNPEIGISATTSKITTGFIYHYAKLVVIGVEELYGKRKQQASMFKAAKQYNSPKAGDFVVHEVHGIGVCEGTEKIKTGDIEKDYVILRYRDGDKLYVPIDQMSMLQKFTGGEAPKLNKIGGKEFEKIKEKVKKSVKKLAIDLIALYGAREKQQGFKYSPDTVFQQEFEEAFPFTETDDQLSAIKDIKSDMESGKLMDRLLCGDVGYGKTEVAFRAIFKTIMDGKQAALLTPTTILTKQHYNTLMARLEGFGIKCELLTRFQNKQQTKATLEKLESGALSIIVATHRILGKDVVFHDLGLLVLDEEQRFGVEHKEKLKAIKQDVNILTLSATPIPRTLSMSLNGLRDISLLETPPVNRLPVQTYVVEYTDSLLKDAVLREIGRGGQVFILYNYVENIDTFAAKVQSLVGTEARVIVAHGQMSNNLLDERMTQFYQKEVNVLVCSSIIENGIDLPDANTLIVYDADRYGLSQLYQLRGRVGRSGALAHAYFTTRENKVVSESGLKRLTALMDYTEFGSGFKIALRDLELRGAGNLLGAEQHGHMEKVGYDMYSRLLREAVEELKYNKTASVENIEVKIDINAFISESYVSQSDKIRIYKRIAEVKTLSDRTELLDALLETYGAPDQPLINLIDIALLKNSVAGFEASKIILGRRGAAVQFEGDALFKNADLMNAVAAHSKEVVLINTPPQIMFDTKNRSTREVLTAMSRFFLEINGNI